MPVVRVGLDDVDDAAIDSDASAARAETALMDGSLQSATLERLLAMLKVNETDTIVHFKCGRTLELHGLLLSLASPVLCDMLKLNKGTKEIHVDDELEAWQQLAAQLYPIFPKPALTWETIYPLLPVVHKYDIADLWRECERFLEDCWQRFSAALNAPNYVLKWLELSDRLRMDPLRAQCLLYINDYVAHKLSADKNSAFYVLRWLEVSERLLLESMRTRCLKLLGELVNKRVLAWSADADALALLPQATVIQVLGLMAQAGSSVSAVFVCTSCRASVTPASANYPNIRSNTCPCCSYGCLRSLGQ